MIKTAVSILAYHGEEYMPELLASMLRHDVLDEAAVIVVDNAPSSAMKKIADEWVPKFPHFFYLPQETNTGFTGGNLIGIAKAKELGAESVQFLNQDALVGQDWLSEARRVLGQDPALGAVQSRVMLWPEKELGNSYGDSLHFTGFGYVNGYLQPWRGGDAPYEITGYPSGAAVLYRIAALDDIGSFDPEAFIYHDDQDLGMKLHLRKWRGVLAPTSIMYHKYRPSITAFKFFWGERGRWLVILKFYKWPTLILLSPVLLLWQIMTLGYSIKEGYGAECFKVWAKLWRERDYIKRIRAFIQSRRLISDREFTSHLTAKLPRVQIPRSIAWLLQPILYVYWWTLRAVMWW